MNRLAFLNVLALASAGLFSSALQRGARGAVPDGTLIEKFAPKPGPVGSPCPVVTKTADEIRKMYPQSTFPVPAPHFGMFTTAGQERVNEFAQTWALPRSLEDKFDFEAFEKDLLDIRREHSEVFDTAVRESIFIYWHDVNYYQGGTFADGRSRYALLTKAFDVILASTVVAAPDYGMSTSTGNLAIHNWAENFEDKSVGKADLFSEIVRLFPRDFEPCKILSKTDFIHDKLFERFGRKKAKAMLDVMERGVLIGRLSA